MNQRPSSLSRLLSQLSGLISIADTEVNRRDLECPHQSEVQLELDFKPLRQHQMNWLGQKTVFTGK